MATSPMVLGSDGDDSDVEGSVRRRGEGNGGLDSRQRLVLAADEASDDADGSDEDFKDEEDERRGLGILGSKTQDFGGERREGHGFCIWRSREQCQSRRYLGDIYR
ncbi:uncharacterized protein A4U43_C04F1090 [Asparagus officinalis]|uniref:Uncharacterized protein n=1 Tax=Asparagus officinalis TaxID=4686 RepID=A0A5P1EXC1_ASPOF|nr:uncharacterized protein A4U43_C04F1090 [Asparagus officinalis]